MPTQGAMNQWKLPDRTYCQRSMRHNPAFGIMEQKTGISPCCYLSTGGWAGRLVMVIRYLRERKPPTSAKANCGTLSMTTPTQHKVAMRTKGLPCPMVI